MSEETVSIVMTNTEPQPCGRVFAYVDGIEWVCDLPKGHEGNCTILPVMD